MAFTPDNEKNTKSNSGFKRDPNMKFPAPRAGNRPARISLIVDLGVQNRPDFEDPKTGEVKPQKPQQQVAVFADLTKDVVDYGGSIGEQPYRLMLNKVFKGEMDGINFGKVPPRDPNGNLIEGKEWTLHPASPLTKIAKATGREDVIVSADIEKLLDAAFLAEVEVKTSEGTKKDENGKNIVYTNVNYKGASKLPEIDDGVFMSVPELSTPARCVTFKNATVEDIKYLRFAVINKIKTANNYQGSQMQKAIEEYEAEQAENAPAQQAKSTNAKTEPKQSKPKAAPKSADDFDDSEVPF